ncbi:MAG TPA: hypothetical protein VHB21_22555, partial [Minicystis sp.]|nr:hypothetical protein [Minicystis sp.]
DPTALAQGLAPGANPLDPSQLDGGVPGAGLLGDPNDPAAMPGGASGNPMDAISGIVMTMVYPDLKTYFESSARRITVDLTWREGVKNYTLTIEQWVVQPQPGLPDDEDDPTADDSVALTPGGRPTGSHGSTRANPSRMLPTAPHLGAKP